MARPVWFVKLIEKAFPKRFVVAKLTQWPVISNWMQHWLAKGDDLIYLTHDQVVPIYQALEAPESMVLPSQVVDYFIEKASYHWILAHEFLHLPRSGKAPELPQRPRLLIPRRGCFAHQSATRAACGQRGGA